MDTVGLINLVLITVIYSTFIAPALTKLGQIRDDIADLIPPDMPDDDEDNSEQSSKDEELTRYGDSLEKKFVLYGLKYRSLKRLLRYFNTIIGIIYASLLFTGVRGVITKRLYMNFVWIVLVGVILVLLRIAVRTYMLNPNKVRSTSWLVGDAGVNPSYYKKLINARLMAELKVSDSDKSVASLIFSVAMERMFVGYRYILTIENVRGDKCYYVSVGLVGKNNEAFNLFTYKGRIEGLVTIASLKLQTGNYRAQLLLFDSPFEATVPIKPVICSVKFKVDTDKIDRLPVYEDIDMKEVCESISFEGVGYKLKNISCLEQTTTDRIAVSFLEQKRFRKLFQRAKRQYSLASINGNLDKTEINKYVRRTNMIRKSSRRLLTRKNSIDLI